MEFTHRRAARSQRAGLDFEPFAIQLELSTVHPELVPMQRGERGYVIRPSATDWLELPAERGFAGFGLGTALRMLLDVLAGMNALHESSGTNTEPYVHGELAPLHFRIDGAGVCRLLPLTARHERPEVPPLPGPVLGYLSPERLISQPIGVRADVFSAGILLWEALAGQRLFEEASADAIFRRMMNGPLSAPTLPAQHAWAQPLLPKVEQALHINQQRRFANCRELIRTISDVGRDHLATHAEVAAFVRRALEPAPLAAEQAAAPAPSRRPPPLPKKLQTSRPVSLPLLPQISAPPAPPPRRARAIGPSRPAALPPPTSARLPEPMPASIAPESVPAAVLSASNLPPRPNSQRSAPAAGRKRVFWAAAWMSIAALLAVEIIAHAQASHRALPAAQAEAMIKPPRGKRAPTARAEPRANAASSALDAGDAAPPKTIVDCSDKVPAPEHLRARRSSTLAAPSPNLGKDYGI